ncbi:MAG: signal peptidase I [Saccharofermentans sp.]|nr:signal peptidase I [Saccharofermentans sp.]
MKKTGNVGVNNVDNKDKNNTRDWEMLPPKEDEPVGKAVAKEVLSWIKTIAIGVIIGVLVVVFIVQRDNVYGDSMFSTLKSGDVVFTEKVSTYFNNFDRGDIVILDGANMEGYDHEEYLIKRIIGLPGETIKIEDGKVFIKKVGASDFVELQEDYLDPGTTTTVMAHGLMEGYDCFVLGDDEYYCMGDNRLVSNDSRNLGPFSADRIKGIAVLRVYPLGSFGTLGRPKYDIDKK